MGQSTEVLADNYMREIVQLHGIPVIIVSDRDTGKSSEKFKDLSHIQPILLLSDKLNNPIRPFRFLIIFVRRNSLNRY